MSGPEHYTIPPVSPAWSRHHRMPATGQCQPPHTEDGGLVSVSPGTQSGQHQLPWHSTLGLTNWPLGCSSSTLWSSSASTPALPRPPWRRPAPRRQTPASSTPSLSSMFPWTGPAPTPPSTTETPSLWPSETQSSFSFSSLPRLSSWQTFRWVSDNLRNIISTFADGGTSKHCFASLMQWRCYQKQKKLILLNNLILNSLNFSVSPKKLHFIFFSTIVGEMFWWRHYSWLPWTTKKPQTSTK